MKAMNPKSGLDNIMTPSYLATKIVEHFRPHGWILEPCFGDGAFLTAMQHCGSLFGFETRKDTCFNTDVEFEDLGYDFLEAVNVPSVDWAVTNPPFSLFRQFLNKSMQVADNVVFLCPINHLATKARLRDISKAGFGIIEILQVDTPPKPWVSTGFQLGAVWIRRGWSGSVHWR